MNVLKKYDSWSWERISRHVLYWLLWAIFFVFVNIVTQPEFKLWQWAAFEGLVLPVKIVSSYTIAYGLMPRFLYRKHYWQFFSSAFLSVMVFGMLLYLVSSYVVNPYILDGTDPYPISKFVYKGLELVYIAALVLGIKFFQNYVYEQQRNQILAEQKVQAELKYLKNQMQPHFLFNTLNNIYGMVLSNDKSAADYIVKLSELLSYMLYDSDTKTIELSKEIEMLDSFIELERLRYHRKLDFSYSKGKLTPYLKIAPLLLIPFVENAFKHGPAKEEGASLITINVDTQNSILYFSVENSYSHQDNDPSIQSGIGLENIKKRLDILYPDRHTLNIEKDTTFKISLMIELDHS